MAYLDVSYDEASELENMFVNKIYKWFEVNHKNLAPTNEEVEQLAQRLAENAMNEFSKDMLNSSPKIINMLMNAYCCGFAECKWVTLGESHLPGFGGEQAEFERDLEEQERQFCKVFGIADLDELPFEIADFVKSSIAQGTLGYFLAENFKVASKLNKLETESKRPILPPNPEFDKFKNKVPWNN